MSKKTAFSWTFHCIPKTILYSFQEVHLYTISIVVYNSLIAFSQTLSYKKISQVQNNTHPGPITFSKILNLICVEILHTKKLILIK